MSPWSGRLNLTVGRYGSSRYRGRVSAALAVEIQVVPRNQFALSRKLLRAFLSPWDITTT